MLQTLSFILVISFPGGAFIIDLKFKQMGMKASLCTSTSSSVLQTEISNTIQFDGQRFILPTIINFEKQATFLKIEAAAKSFCQSYRINLFYYPLVTRMIAYRHEQVFIKAWEKVKQCKRQQFLDELNAIQHDLMDSFYHHYFQKEKGRLSFRKTLKINHFLPPTQHHPQPQQLYSDIQQGKYLLKSNKIATIIMLAGYSSRFQLDDKFLSPISLFEKVTILDLMFARLKHNGIIPKNGHIALVCNDENIDKVRKHLQTKQYFGFTPNNVKLLTSFALPIFDQQGQYCFNQKIHLIKRSAGTANCAQQLFTSGLYDVWKAKGIEYVYFSGGQNLLENPCDPALVGRMIKKSKKAAIKCVKSQFFQQAMPRFYFGTADSLKILQNQHFSQLSSSILQKLPIPINSMIFELQTLSKVMKDYASNMTLAANYQQIQLQSDVFNFDKEKSIPTKCFNFQKDIRYLFPFIKQTLLYRVHRPDQFAPIMSKTKKYSFNEAVKHYRDKLQKQLIKLAQ